MCNCGKCFKCKEKNFNEKVVATKKYVDDKNFTSRVEDSNGNTIRYKNNVPLKDIEKNDMNLVTYIYVKDVVDNKNQLISTIGKKQDNSNLQIDDIKVILFNTGFILEQGIDPKTLIVNNHSSGEITGIAITDGITNLANQTSIKFDGISGVIDPDTGVIYNPINKEFPNKQDKLISGTNIKMINEQSILGQGNINTNQFTNEEVKRLKLLLNNTAFGINKNTSELEQKGFFTQQIFYNDLDKPNDNIVTDNVGNDLNIRRVAFFHYSGTAWYKSDGSLGVRYYLDKLTYNNQEVETKTTK